MIDNCLDDWRIAMTWQRVLQISAEVSSKKDFYWVIKVIISLVEF
jgi:hypothetical protein